MSALDAFYSTWDQARNTFGSGAPQTGAEFDRSSQLRDMQTAVQAATPDSRWQGSAADAYTAKNQQHAAVYGKLADLDKRMATEVDRSAAVVTAGRQNLDQIRDWVTSAAASAPNDKSGEYVKLAIASKGLGQISDIIQQSNSEMTAIGERVRGIGKEYDEIGGDNKKKAPDAKEMSDKDRLNTLTGDANPDDVRARAQKDVEAALSGDKDAIGRVRTVLKSIDGNQLAGNQHLSPDQSAYLSQMQAQQKGMSLDAIKHAADNGAKDIMADSWQLLSNPKIFVSNTDLEHGALNDPNYLVRGGLDRLPDSVQQVITGPDKYAPYPNTDLSTVADIVGHGNPSYQTNTELDQGLLHKVSDMMASPNWSAAPSASGVRDFSDLPISETLAAISPDHQLVHDAMTGQMHGQFSVDSQKFLGEITHHAWTDQGEGAGKLFSWTEAMANDPAQGHLAAETAHAYSQYIGGHENELLHNLPGNQPLGQLDPKLVQGMAHGLAPYVNNIAGTSGALDSQHFGNLDDNAARNNGQLPFAKGVFSVLNSDYDAARYFDSHAYAQQILHEAEYAKNPSDANSRQLWDASTLRALVDVGNHNAAEAGVVDSNHAKVASANDQYQWKKMAYEDGVRIAGTLASAVPDLGPAAGLGVATLGAHLENSIVPPPTVSQQPVDFSVPELSPGDADQMVLSSYLASGHSISDLPGIYIVDGQIASPQYMETRYGIDPGQYQQDLGNAMNSTFGNGAVADSVRVRYNQIIHDPVADPQHPITPPPPTGG